VIGVGRRQLYTWLHRLAWSFRPRCVTGRNRFGAKYRPDARNEGVRSSVWIC